MIAEALAVAALRLEADGSAVLARIGGSIGLRARAVLVRLEPSPDGSNQKLVRAEWSAIARAPVPPGMRGVHASWIEHALEAMPARARAAVASGGGGGPVDVWLARWATADFVAMPPTRPGPPRRPDDVALLDARELTEWLAGVGEDQLAYVFGAASGDVRRLEAPLRAAAERIIVAPRLGQLGPVRAAIARCTGSLVDIGARTVAPHLSSEVRRVVVARLPRSVGLGVARAFRDYATTSLDQGPAWPALVA